jgi:hypothetical protein
MSFLSAIGGAIGGLLGGGGASGIIGQVQNEQQNLLNTQGQDQIDSMKNMEAQDKMSTAAQEATSWANTMNQIAKEFSDVSQAKTQADSGTAKASSDATKQA